MNEVQQTILEQIDWRELRLAKFKIVILGNDQTGTKFGVRLVKASKVMDIIYNRGSDTYKIVTYRTMGRSKQAGALINEREDVFFEDLKPAIQSFFKFEYVMRGLIGKVYDARTGKKIM